MDYLSSAGVGLLIDIALHAEVHQAQLQMQLIPYSLVARFLAITGVERILPVATEQSASER